MSFKHILLSAGAAAMFCFQSCGGSAPDPSTPTGSVMSAVEAVKSNNVSDIVDCVLTPEQRSKVATEWKNNVSKNPPSDSENKRFAAQLDAFASGQMTDQVMGMVEPMLPNLTGEVLAGQIEQFAPMLLSGVATTPEKQAEMEAVKNSLVAWVKTAELNDPNKVRKVLGIAQNAAKSLGVKDLNDVAALSFDQLLGKGDIVLGAVKDALDVYGISIDDTMSSIKVTKVEEKGNTASVTIEYEMFGAKHSSTTVYNKVGNRWFDAESSKQMAQTFAGM